nr:aminopeptidase P family protein [bacterium]
MIPLKEYASRRAKITKQLKGATGIVFAGESEGERTSTWRPHPHFEYLTGITNEPEAMLLFDPTNPVAFKREILFLSARDPEVEQWDGIRLPLGSKLKKKTGFRTILRSRHLSYVLADIASRNKSFATLMPNSKIEAPISKDIELWEKIARRTPNYELTDCSHVIPKMRSVKSTAEIRMIQEAVDMTARGFADAMAFIKEGVNEFQVQATLEHGYAMAGGRGSAFPSIVGGGINSTVLHYKENDQDLCAGDMVCIDSGAFHQGYGADISRTIPVSGTFSKRQKEVYNIVLAAEEAAIKAVKPGVTINELDAVARAVINKAGYGEFFIHGIGHHLGLETHDACGPPFPFKKGAVITIEPGIYLPDEAIGIRIEDDILV